MANTQISSAVTTGRLKAAADHVVDLLDGGTIEIRDGTQPSGTQTYPEDTPHVVRVRDDIA